MGQTQSLSTHIEINASPSTVQSVFMDFSKYPQWSSWTIEPTNPLRHPSELTTSDVLKIDMKGMKFQPRVVSNTPEMFSWEGSLYGLLVGKHDFFFTPSKTIKGGTTMVQNEVFTGVLAFIFAPVFGFRRQTIGNWDEFCGEIKREAEKVEGERRDS